MSGNPHSFKSEGSYKIVGRGVVYAVKLTEDTEDFSDLVDKQIEINGKVYVCKGIERFLHCPPWHKGETIGILT